MIDYSETVSVTIFFLLKTQKNYFYYIILQNSYSFAEVSYSDESEYDCSWLFPSYFSQKSNYDVSKGSSSKAKVGVNRNHFLIV